MSRAFTLLEIIVVLVIIAILAGIGMPNYFASLEKARASEAINTLGAIRSAQMRNHDQLGAYVANGGENNYTSLDIEIKSDVATFFDFHPSAGVVEDSCITSVAKATRKVGGQFGDYSLCIDANSTILCTGGTGNICQKLGY